MSNELDKNMEKYDLTNKKELIKVTKDIMSGPFANALIAVNPLVPVILKFGGMILDKIYSTETLKLQKDTAESLIKSGVLGEEYNRQLEDCCDEELSNDLIRHVITDMKKLAQGLEDRELCNALCVSADGILALYKDWHDWRLWPQVPGHEDGQKARSLLQY